MRGTSPSIPNLIMRDGNLNERLSVDVSLLTIVDDKSHSAHHPIVRVIRTLLLPASDHADDILIVK